MRLGPSVDQVKETIFPLYQGTVSRKKLIYTLNDRFGSSSLEFVSERKPYFLPDFLSVSGSYDPVDDLRSVNIVHASHIRKLFIRDLNRFSFLISQTIKHETIHRRQRKYRYDKRYMVSKKSYINKYRHSESRYLADPEEIHAYAHDIALEVIFFYPKKPPLYVIENIESTKKLDSYNYYKSIFRGQPWNQVKNSLIKQTKKWLPHVNL